MEEKEEQEDLWLILWEWHGSCCAGDLGNFSGMMWCG
jgi:hypothetical protein